MTDPETVAAELEGLVHAPTQVGERGVDLTVASVADLNGPGRVDFGGGELESAETSPRETHRRDPADEYAWWHLDPGTYLLSYNESLVDHGTFWLQPRDALLERGAHHPTCWVDELGPLPLSVGDGGLLLKENARVSTLRMGQG